MKNTTPLLRAGIALAAALTLTGCAASGTGTTPTTSASASAEATSKQVNDADEMFVQMMRPHHEQAIELSDMLLAKTGISPEVTALATESKEAQVPEIEQLSAWADQLGLRSDVRHEPQHGRHDVRLRHAGPRRRRGRGS